MKMIITNEMYLTAIENAIATEGITVADTMNKIALEQGAITQAQYSMGAQLIVDAYLN